MAYSASLINNGARAFQHHGTRATVTDFYVTGSPTANEYGVAALDIAHGGPTGLAPIAVHVMNITTVPKYFLSYDASDTTNGPYAQLSDPTALDAFDAAYEVCTDGDAAGDGLFIGADSPISRVDFDLSTTATWSADGGTWGYVTAATPASTALTSAANSLRDTTASTADRPFLRDGTVSFIPPGGWSKVTLNSQSAYWLRMSHDGTTCTRAAVAQLINAAHDITGVWNPEGSNTSNDTMQIVISHANEQTFANYLINELAGVKIRAIAYFENFKTGGKIT